MTIQNPYLGSVPMEGPKALSTLVELLPPARTEIDLRIKFDTAFFMGCQTIYFDGSSLIDDVELSTSLGQSVLLRKNTQGYINILEGVAMKFLFKSKGSSIQNLPVIFLNQAIATTVWATKANSVELPIASTTELGGIKVGQNLSIDSEGVLNAAGGTALPIATPLVLGGVKVGSGLAITGDGILSATGGGGGGGSISITDICTFFIDETSAEVEAASWASSLTVEGSEVVLTLDAGLYQFTMEAGIDSPAGAVIVSAFKIAGTSYTVLSNTFAVATGEEFSTLSPVLFVASATTLTGRISLPASMTYLDAKLIKIA